MVTPSLVGKNSFNNLNSMKYTHTPTKREENKSYGKIIPMAKVD